MSALCLPDRRAAGKARLGAMLLAVLASWALAGVADARITRLHTSRARLDVVNTEGDTVSIARPMGKVSSVTISREGIRIQSGDKVVVQDRAHGRPRGINFDIQANDTTYHIHALERPGSGDMVNFFEDVHIPAGRVVNGQVVDIIGNIKVDGAIEGDVVSILGDVELGDSARVGGDVVSVGGAVRAAPTAEIQGQQVSVPVVARPHMASWLPSAAMAMLMVFFSFIGALVALLFPERLVRVSQTASRRTLLSLVLGVLTFPMLPVVFILLCITVIGIPVALLLLVLYPVAAFLGYVASCALIGARISGRPLGEPSLWRQVLVGFVLVGIFFVIGGLLTCLPGTGGVPRIIGFFLVGAGLLIASVNVLLGLGALLLSRMGEPERAAPVGPAPVSAPGLAMPVAPAAPRYD